MMGIHSIQDLDDLAQLRDENERLFLRNQYLEKRHKRDMCLVDSVLEARERIHHMAYITGAESSDPRAIPYPRVGCGEIPSNDPTGDVADQSSAA